MSLIRRPLQLFGAAPVVPSITSIRVALQNGGACSGARVGTPAVVRCSWVVVGAENSGYTLKLLKDGSFRATIASGTTTTNDFTVSGFVADATGHALTSAYIYRLDWVRNGDSVVVATRTATTFANSFGDCSGLA